MTQIPPRIVLFVRLALAAIWAFEGLWLKVLARDAHELRIVSSSVAPIGIAGGPAMLAIGLAETLLAIGIVSGVMAKPLAWIQAVVLLSMNLIGIAFGGGEIREPISLLVHNLPTFAGIAVVAACGPGSWRTRENA